MAPPFGRLDAMLLQDGSGLISWVEKMATVQRFVYAVFTLTVHWINLRWWRQLRQYGPAVFLGSGNEILTGRKYMWLKRPPNRSMKHGIPCTAYSYARAWAIKETARNLWHDKTRGWALKSWKKWLSWAMRCRLEPMKKATKTIKNHQYGILNAIVLKGSNGPAERIHSRIKTIKVRARGFQNKARFIDAIYFHLGGLDLSPRT